ncbi:MAG: tRNA pseudouridine(55) synthase TruB [Bacteroidia bacterium]|nr:tRNA pseudouridine(55) synthase TruB [Bacteroidia bacterium]MCZ2247719.1 tRNA pseudouridine(55) synthase TruB [Bacteroidia bacterium]
MFNPDILQAENIKNGTVILFHKPQTWTSFDIVNYVRKALNTKIGHAGTLDPLATGLLILCTEKMTKKIEQFQDLDKEYTGTIVIGKTTPSFDLETEISETKPVENIENKDLLQVAQQFIGKQQQIAPLFSAKKIDGERAYHKARRGESAEITAREIEIKQFEISDIRRNNDSIEVDFLILCTKGTYIRAIARDFGLKLNNVAYLSKLVRTRIGDYLLENAITLEKFREFFPSTRK